ncbi:hypothetical protein ElyMa_005336600 [Elysia marginata]|uniref:Uncharacterized protein n=1 Tax=Elysia marginata TaxID=1093978 RepID=A0AAV4EA70_9GAST|nr:hypothetical protein ElyMa_005336600 [Elysia marginata]
MTKNPQGGRGDPGGPQTSSYVFEMWAFRLAKPALWSSGKDTRSEKGSIEGEVLGKRSRERPPPSQRKLDDIKAWNGITGAECNSQAQVRKVFHATSSQADCERDDSRCGERTHRPVTSVTRELARRRR